MKGTRKSPPAFHAEKVKEFFMQTTFCFLFLIFFHSIAFGEEKKTIKDIVPANLLKFVSYGYLPDVDDLTLKEIFSSSETYWYDKESLPHVYQDSIHTVHGVRSLSAGLEASAERDGHLVFDSKGFLFPFANAFGTDKAPNVYLLNFLSLPKVNGKRLNIPYKILDNRWKWMFPKGTIIGEILMIETPKGLKQNYYAVEIRTRKRYIGGWEPNVYRPFQNALQLADQIAKLKPNWKDDEKLTKVVNHLKTNNNLVEAKLSATSAMSSAFPAVSGYLDVIPDFGDDQLVADLLKKTKFKSVEGKVWKADGAKRTFGPSTASAFSITPQNFEGGLFPVNEISCNRCHELAGSAIGRYSGQTVLYGEIWGEDNIFTWHLFDSSLGLGNFNNNRTLHSQFSEIGLVEPFNPEKHSEEYYKQLPTK